MIQDQCSPFFALLTTDAELLLDLDSRVFSASGGDDTGDVADLLKSLTDCEPPRLVMTDAQTTFLKEFAYERPLFWGDTGQDVPDVAPWIYLACDTSFGDASGPRPEEFIRNLENANREILVESLRKCSETRAPAVVDALGSYLTERPDVTQRAEQLDLLLAVLLDVHPSAPLPDKLVKRLAESLPALTEGVDDAALRVPLIATALAVFEHHGFASLPDGLASVFAFRNGGDLQHLPRGAYGRLGSGVVSTWLAAFYGQKAPECLTQLGDLLCHLDRDAVTSELSDLGRRVADDILTDGDSGRRTARLNLVAEYFPDQRERVRDAVLTQTDHADVWAWAVDAADSGDAPWTSEDLESALIAWVIDAGSVGELQSRLGHAVGKLESQCAALWGRLAEVRMADLVSLLDQLVGDHALSSLEFPKDVRDKTVRGPCQDSEGGGQRW